MRRILVGLVVYVLAACATNPVVTKQSYVPTPARSVDSMIVVDSPEMFKTVMGRLGNPEYEVVGEVNVDMDIDVNLDKAWKQLKQAGADLGAEILLIAPMDVTSVTGYLSTPYILMPMDQSSFRWKAFAIVLKK